ncbi:MAG: hypothetical protein JW940_00775 [Polyangiaceae bacterium]|nr:hypothetical protein [Polyangiaceae bacterium]
MESLVLSLLLLDTSGALIIGVIGILLLLGIAASVAIRARYTTMAKELHTPADRKAPFRFGVLQRAVSDMGRALQQVPAGGDAHSINVQGIAERAMQQELKSLLMGERFVRANTGLLITLGLVGTFYGLTRSIGKLVSIVSGDLSPQADLAQSLTRGLTEALSGMSVAFTTSLAGILAAICMTLLGVVLNIAERRAAFTLQLETHLDQLVLTHDRAAGSTLGPRATEQFEAATKQLEGSVLRFEGALSRFAENTRDFHEFNAHLKDNIQRLSLCFADLAEVVQRGVAGRAGKEREPGAGR